MQSRFLIRVGLATGLLAPQARANDSAAELAAGGITLVRSDGIATVSEPTTFVVERTDFTPTEDLRVLFIPANP